jgi:DsbC/DsbD-like thiol-disulfide interchange protein
MHQTVLFGVLGLAVLAFAAPSLPGGAKKSDSVVKVKATLDTSAAGKDVVVVKIDIQQGWHLYANPVKNDDLTASQVVVKIADVPATITYPAGKSVEEKTIGKYQIYEDKVEIRATLDRPAGAKGPVEVSVRLYSCSDMTCLPPATVKLTVP